MNRPALARLKRFNPFASGAAPEPGAPRYPDVPGLGDEAFEGILALAAAKAARPQLPMAATVLGEAGSGKTHLIGRLAEACHGRDAAFDVAYIRPPVNPDSLFSYLLREIVARLAGRNQGSRLLDAGGRVLSRVIFAAAEKNDNPKLARLARRCKKDPTAAVRARFHPKVRAHLFKTADRLLKEQIPAMAQSFRRVFLLHVLFPRQRAEALQWLMGNAVDDPRVIRCAGGDRARASVFALEDEARELLRSLDLLLGAYGRLCAVFFDQLENLNHPPNLISAFQRIIYFLSDETAHMMPLAFFRGKDWDYTFRDKLDDFCTGRLSANIFELTGCSRKQARDLVRSRLDFALADLKRPDPLYPFLPEGKDEFETIFHEEEIPPRTVIRRSNLLLQRMISGAALREKSMETALARAWDRRVNEFRTAPSLHPPDADRLDLALTLYLENRPWDFAYRIEGGIFPGDDEPPASLVFTDRETGKKLGRPILFLTDVSAHHSAVAAQLRKGLDFLAAHFFGCVVLVKDGRNPIPAGDKWPKTRDLMDRFQAAGGAVVVLSKTMAPSWYALSSLRFDIVAGDVTPDGGEVAGISDLASFAERLSGNTDPAFLELDRLLFSGGPENPLFEQGLADSARGILENQPSGFLAADELARLLGPALSARLSPEKVLGVLARF